MSTSDVLPTGSATTETTMEKLTANRVDTAFRDCLFADGEDRTDFVKAEGVVHTFGFHPGRLKAHESEVREMLEELPEQFMADGRGGWSFLNAPMDKNGDQWGEQVSAEQLLCMGIGLGLVRCQLPREMWSALPGGVPYYVVDLRSVAP